MNNQGDHEVAGYYDGLSVVSRYIRMYFGQTLLGSGTCFFVMSKDGPVLITNRHNFTGRHNITGELLHRQGGVPDHAVVTMHGPQEIHYHIDLVDHANRDAPAWTEHPTLGPRADIAALPVKEMENIVGELNSVSLQNDWHRWDLGSELYVVGYPYGQIGGPFPIWSKGSIASEPDFDISGLPLFLIDCRSRPGQSGSPVFAHIRAGAVVEHEGRDWQAKKPMNYFVGAYSGRLRPDSDLGLVWKRACIEELVNHAITDGTQHRMDLCRHRFAAPLSAEFSLDRYISDELDWR